MPYLVSQVFDAAAEWVGDPSKEQATDANLMPSYQNAWGDLTALCRQFNLPTTQRPLFTVLPANVTRISPTIVNDFSTPIAMFDRGTPLSYTILSTTAATPIMLTFSGAHGRSTGDQVDIENVDASIDGNYYVNVLSPTTLELVGSSSTAAFITGTMIYSGEEFFPVPELQNYIPLPPNSQSTRITGWKFENGVVKLLAANQAREIMLQYNTNGAAPVTGYLGWDEAFHFLSHATASYYAAPDGQEELAGRERRLAYGTSGNADGRGGLLRQVIMPLMLQKGQIMRRPLPFRPRREAYVGSSIIG